MLGWLFFFSIIALFVLLLCIPMRLIVRYRTSFPARAYLQWLFMKHDLTGDEISPAKRKKKKKKPKEKAASTAPKKRESPQVFANQLGIITDLVVSLVKDHLRKLVRKIRIYKLELNMLVGGEDAAQTAITYGQVNAAVYSAYGLAGRVFNMAQPKIDIRPCFTSEESDIFFELRARLLPLFLIRYAVFAAAQFLVRVLRRGAKAKENLRPDRKDRPPREERADRSGREMRAERENCETRDERKTRIDLAERDDLDDRDNPASVPPQE